MRDFAPAYEFIRTATGLTFPEARRASVSKVFTEAMAERGLRTAADLVADMRADASLRDRVVASVTIGETYFFRDPGQFEVIRRTVLPDLLAHKPATSPIRLWSAAAASGEEAYSLAILMEEQGLRQRAKITATDIARPRLAAAQAGRFKKWSLRGVADDTIDRYFTRDRDSWVLAPRLRESVDFSYLNLAEDTYPSLALGIYDMDLILCRNVLIYFDEATVCRVAQHLVDSLSRFGWLLIGASDPPISHLVGCEVVTTSAGLAYRRTSAGGTQWVGACADDSAAPDPAPAAKPAWQDFVHPEAIEPAPPTEERVPPSPLPAAEPVAAERVRALCNAGDTGEAASLALRGLEQDGTNAELHYLLAVALSHEGSNDDAIRSAKRALYLNRDLVIAHVLLGQLYDRTNQRPLAQRALRNAVDLLATQEPEAIVAATDGERVGRIREVIAVQLRLLTAAA